jgi:hypothetical protein
MHGHGLLVRIINNTIVHVITFHLCGRVIPINRCHIFMKSNGRSNENETETGTNNKEPRVYSTNESERLL